jgi:hypothetical protein
MNICRCRYPGYVWEGVGTRGSQRRLQRTVNTLFLSALLYERLETIILLISQEFYLLLTLLTMTNSYVLFWTPICIHSWCVIELIWRLVRDHFYSVCIVSGHTYSTAPEGKGGTILYNNNWQSERKLQGTCSIIIL